MRKFLFTALFALISTLAFSQERIAVFPFQIVDNAINRTDAVLVYRNFSNEFANRSRGISVIPRLDVERLIDMEMDFQLSILSAPEKTAEYNRVLNGTQILSGLIARSGNSIHITVSLYTYPELKQLPGGVDRRVANNDELFRIIPELVQSMQDIIAGGITEQSAAQNFLYEIVDGRTVTITGYTGEASVLNIPSQIDGLLVTAIGDHAFANCNFTSVTIPPSVTQIGHYAFRGSSSLTSVTIPSSVTSIEESAFWYCSSLTSITVDNRNPNYASIDGVLFDKNIRTIIQYPPSKNQRVYAIPSSVTSIGYDAFWGCSNLTSITIPSSVTSMINPAFSVCSSLTSITVDNRNPAYASIDGVLFDKNIQTLIQYPQAKNQRTYVIPSSVISIDIEAFSNCRNLTSIAIPPSVTFIETAAFVSCNNLTSITIPSSVTSIGSAAFQDCNSLTNVTIPFSVTTIGLYVFNNCSSLTSITVDNRNPAYASIDGVLFDKNIQTLITYPRSKNQRTYVIPSSVTSIEGYAFSGCSSLTNITIPSSVISIGHGAFYRCNNLTNITLSRRTQVGENAFPASAQISYWD